MPPASALGALPRRGRHRYMTGMPLEPTDRPMPELRDDTLDLLSGLIDKARRAGADAADAVLYDSTSISISYRLNK